MASVPYGGGIGSAGSVGMPAGSGPVPAASPASNGGRRDPRVQASPGIAGPRLVEQGDTIIVEDAGIEPTGLAAATTPRRSDCAWCRYGKPLAAGAALGALAAAAAGSEWSRGALWGGLAGLAYGQAFKGG